MKEPENSPRLPIKNSFGLRAALVGPFAGVNADFLALVDEGRYLDDKAGLGPGGLGDAGGGGRLKARLGLDNCEFNGRRQVDAHCLSVVVGDLDLEVGGEVLDGVAEG